MIAIIDYNMGNVGSVRNAVLALGAEVALSSKREEIEKATHIILPGVGTFGDGMARLTDSGVIPILETEVLEKKKPFLGICLGMQVMAEFGEEGGRHKGLGWIKGQVRRLEIDEKELCLPHIGWNDVVKKTPSSLFENVISCVFYFIHSYVLVPEEKSNIIASCAYGEKFTAAVEKDNIFGVQFHPEKSQKSGLTLLRNFLDYHA
ncbi:MAG: imidazole glycerol phosphate synthase subunit HisH [Candidatus Spechtbacteria bacterium]|nr:imidazole glycerol phosphate synthase subunit HisH [Candidatus Spechtbacteria bacterium]